MAETAYRNVAIVSSEIVTRRRENVMVAVKQDTKEILAKKVIYHTGAIKILKIGTFKIITIIGS